MGNRISPAGGVYSYGNVGSAADNALGVCDRGSILGLSDAAGTGDRIL